MINETKRMKYEKEFRKCRDFFDRVAELLEDSYTVVGSCNEDLSAYLVPNGTEDEVTYHSKPDFSFRVSDHWNWYANLKKCRDSEYVQCHSVNLPGPFPRLASGKASKPFKSAEVCITFDDGKYHCIYGRKFNNKTGRWEWKESTPEEVVDLIWKSARLKKLG